MSGDLGSNHHLSFQYIKGQLLRELKAEALDMAPCNQILLEREEKRREKPIVAFSLTCLEEGWRLLGTSSDEVVARYSGRVWRS